MSSKKKKRRKLTLFGKVVVVLILLIPVVFGVSAMKKAWDEKKEPVETQSETPKRNEKLYEVAQDIYDEIITDSMTQMEKAFVIYNWVRTNVRYTEDSMIVSWEDSAYQAFVYRSGDCYTYFSAGKVLLNMAGIENIDMEKSKRSESTHFWSLINIGSGWYHFDCTPRYAGGDFFMLTDEELAAYSEANGDTHAFVIDRYPPRATESVQQYVDYENGIIRKNDLE